MRGAFAPFLLALFASAAGEIERADLVLYAQGIWKFENRAREITRNHGTRFPAPTDARAVDRVNYWLLPAFLELKWRVETFETEPGVLSGFHSNYLASIRLQCDFYRQWIPVATNAGAGAARATALGTLASASNSWRAHRDELIRVLEERGLDAAPLR